MSTQCENNNQFDEDKAISTHKLNGLVNKKYTEWTTTARTQLINMLGKDRLTIKAHTIQSQHVMVLFIGSHTENPNRTLPFIRISMLLFGCVFAHVVNARARHTVDNANAFSWSTKQQYHNQEKWRLVCVYVCLTDNTQNRTHRTVLFELYIALQVYMSVSISCAWCTVLNFSVTIVAMLRRVKSLDDNNELQ